MTNVCRSDMLSRYLDDVLTLSERRQLEEHVDRCDPCRQELEALRRIDHLLKVWGSRRRPLASNTDVRIARSIDRRRRLPRIVAMSKMMPAAVGSCIAALLVVVSINVGLLYQQNQVASGPATAHQHSFVNQSRALVNARRAAAIQGMVTVQPQAIPRHRMQFDFN
jgi:predicted anti-sigma-YlaC factor YlaD